MGTRSLPHSGSSGRAPGQGEEVAIERPSCSYFQFQGSDTPGNRVDNSRVSSSASGRCDPRKGSFGGTCLDDSTEDLWQIQAGWLVWTEIQVGGRRSPTTSLGTPTFTTNQSSRTTKPRLLVSMPICGGGEGQVRQLRGANAQTGRRIMSPCPWSFFSPTRPRRMRGP